MQTSAWAWCAIHWIQRWHERGHRQHQHHQRHAHRSLWCLSICLTNWVFVQFTLRPSRRLAWCPSTSTLTTSTLIPTLLTRWEALDGGEVCKVWRFESPSFLVPSGAPYVMLSRVCVCTLHTAHCTGTIILPFPLSSVTRCSRSDVSKSFSLGRVQKPQSWKLSVSVSRICLFF